MLLAVLTMQAKNQMDNQLNKVYMKMCVQVCGKCRSLIKKHTTVKNMTPIMTTALHILTTTTTILWTFDRDCPGELVPEETITHSQCLHKLVKLIS